MPPPVQKQSRSEGAHRPWSLREKSAKAYCRKPETEAQRRERETCLSCPEPECDPDYCHHRSEAKHGKRPPGIPKDFLIQMDLGTSVRKLAERYGVTQRTISLWKQAVKKEAAPAGTGTTSEENRTVVSVSAPTRNVKRG